MATVVIVITLTYAYKRYIVMSEYSDTAFMSTNEIDIVSKDSPLR